MKLFLIGSGMLASLQNTFTYEQIIHSYYVPGCGDIVIIEDNKVLAIIKDRDEKAELLLI